MRTGLCLLIVSTVLTACATSQPSTDTAEAEIRESSDRFWDTRQREDAAALAQQVTEDAILMVPGLPDAVGRTAIRELSEQRFARLRTADFKVHKREIEIIGDSAYELAWYSEASHAQGQSHLMEGRYLIVWKRGSDDRWRVHRNFYNFSAATPIEPSSD